MLIGLSRTLGKLSSLLLCVLIFFLTAGAPVTVAARYSVATTPTSVEVTIHYYRFDQHYDGWNLWLWPITADKTSYGGAEHDFTSPPDSFGVVAHTTIQPDPQQTAPTARVGFIVRLGDWQAKDVPQDRSLTITDGRAEVWLVSGDPNVYTSLSDAQVAKEPRVINAYLEGEKTVVAKLTNVLTLPVNTKDAVFKDKTSSKAITVQAIDTAQSYHPVVVGDLQHLLGASNDWNPGDDTTLMKMVHSNLYQLTGQLPAGNYNYKIAFNGNWDGAFPGNNIPLTVPTGGAKVTFSFVPFDPATHQEKVYDSINDANAQLPTSSAGVQTDLLLVTLAKAPDITHTLSFGLTDYKEQMVLPRNVLNDKRYFYSGDDLGNRFTPRATTFRLWAPTASDIQLLLYNSETGPLTLQVAMKRDSNGTWSTRVKQNLENWYYLYQVTIDGSTQIAVDPYVYAMAVNATRGMIIDLTKTNPQQWRTDTYRSLKDPVDAVIYEAHVRDFSIDASSGMTNKGRYLAFTERGTKGPGEVVTGVDSLKQLGISHVQVLPVEAFASVDENDPSQYNWGYDPRNYNVPEGAYATTPHGTARITEYKRMIQSLHSSGIGVVMDVVYNHTFATQVSDFDKIVPQYYYRTDYSGNYTNGSGVGNELATERPMVQKFVRDSIRYWVKEYHVDGFRFDLMALLGTDTMRLVSQDLHQMNPNGILYGEPWTGGASALPAKQLLTKGQQKGLHLGVFNDNIRNGLIGSVFDHSAKGFATGATGQTETIRKGVSGSINDFTAAPSETINYVSSHDNLTLWDKVTASNSTDTEADRIKMDQLAQTVVMTSQGVPFMQGGEEFLRTKGGNDNSYNAGDAVNRFDWTRKSQYQDVFNYYAGLIHLRNGHPAFRMTSAEQINEHLTFLTSPDNTVQFELKDHANGDSWKNILVIYNPNKTEATFTLPDGTWNIVGTAGKVGETVLGQATGTVTAPAISSLILYQNS